MNVGVGNKAKAINQIFVGVNNIAKLVYSSSGGSGSFELPTFTGSNSIFGDEISGRIELYESGTLTLSPGTYDLFLVGGGSGGGSNGSIGNALTTGGGGSGYTKTNLAIELGGNYAITVGGGGTVDGNGGMSQVAETSGSPLYSCNGGTLWNNDNDQGGSGGSGGGAPNGDRENSGGGSGGSDGSNGTVRSGGRAGIGQGTTTRAFEESENTLYAGGGGAGQKDTRSGGAGGAGGGGAGGRNASAGTPNTGGGGGGVPNRSNYGVLNGGVGGSGLIIIRWNNTQS